MKKSIFISIVLFGIPFLSKGQSDLIGSIANDELNFVYYGYKNVISVGVFDASFDAKVSCEGCSSFSPSSKGKYIAHVASGSGEITINVASKGKKLSKKFKAVPLPIPRCHVAGVDPYVNRISRTQLANGIITISVESGSLKTAMQVTGGQVTITVNGISKSFAFTGNSFPTNIQSVINQLQSGVNVVIEPTAVVNGTAVKPPSRCYKIL